jgi:hypothetical protein
MENQSNNPFEEGLPQRQTNLPQDKVILILSIVSIIGCCFFHGIPGIVLSLTTLFLVKKSLDLYKACPERYLEGSYKNINAGKICAYVGLGLSIFNLLMILVMILMFGKEVLSDPFIIYDHFGIARPF